MYILTKVLPPEAKSKDLSNCKKVVVNTNNFMAIHIKEDEEEGVHLVAISFPVGGGAPLYFGSEDDCESVTCKIFDALKEKKHTLSLLSWFDE